MFLNRVVVPWLLTLVFICHAPLAAAQPASCDECTPSQAALAAGARNETLCEPDQRCVNVRECIVEAGCYDDFPSCYCGDGVSLETCVNPAFVPQGPCAAEITAGSESGAPRTEIVQSLNVPDETPTGIALSIIDELVLDDSLCVLDCYARLMAPAVPFVPPVAALLMGGLILGMSSRVLSARGRGPAR